MLDHNQVLTFIVVYRPAETNMDELSDKLNKEQIGCFGENKIIHHFMYADDLVIMAPSSAGLSTLLEICESFGSKHCVKFIPLKSVIFIFRSKLLYKNKLPNFSLNNQNIQEVNKIKYLGHIISNNCSDDADIGRQRRQLYAVIGKLKLLCFGHIASICIRPIGGGSTGESP